MLTIVGWLWKDENCAAKYLPQHADIWARMIHAHLSMPHRFVLVTDWLDYDYCSLIEPVKIWDDWREVRRADWREDAPQCYVRLKAFSEEAREILGDRFVSIDLDCLVLDALDPLFDRSEDFVIYRRPNADNGRPREAATVYQGSMWMMNTGARSDVWTSFHGAESLKQVDKSLIGTDQAWIRHVLGPNEATWGVKDGVYSYGTHVQPYQEYRLEPPAGLRILFFQGVAKPFHFGPLKMLQAMPKKERYNKMRAFTGEDQVWIGDEYWRWSEES